MDLKTIQQLITQLLYRFDEDKLQVESKIYDCTSIQALHSNELLQILNSFYGNWGKNHGSIYIHRPEENLNHLHPLILHIKILYRLETKET